MGRFLRRGAPPAPDPRAEAKRAVAEGRLLDAIGLLERLDHDRGDPDAEIRLVGLRHRAFSELDRTSGCPEWPPTYPDRFPSDAPDIPELEADQLTADLLGSALVNHGSLVVRGLVQGPAVPRLIEGIERVFEARDASGDGSVAAEGVSPWYVPFVPDPSYTDKALSREWVREGGGVWTADSPRMTADVLDLFRAAGLDRVIGEYLGERPAISLRKWVLRRVPPDLGHADWHQDGAFLGPDVRSVNVWLALTPCGEGTAASGLEVVPRRIGLQETGTDGAFFTWSVGQGLVDRLVGEAGTTVACPTFEPGDALLFDDRMLHRTAIGESLTRDRHAIESWFFAPSTYPADQIPLVF
jgi:hypothetical protein